MLIANLNNILSENYVDTGYLHGFYSFNYRSGRNVFNEKFDNPTGNLISGSADKDTYPLYVLDSGAGSFSISGSGYFKSQSLMQVGDEFPNTGWTIFLNFQSNDIDQNLGLSKTLLTSMDSPTGASGFHLGINGSNRLVFEIKI